MGGPDKYNGPPSGLEQAVTPAGVSTIRLYNAGPGPNRGFYFNPAAADTPLSQLRQKQWGHWRAVSLQIQPADPGVPFTPGVSVPANLIVTLKSDQGVDRVTNNLYLAVKINAANQIVSCSRITYASDENPVQICPPPYNALISEGTRIKCRIVSCWVGVPCGYTANGDVKCQTTCP